MTTKLLKWAAARLAAAAVLSLPLAAAASSTYSTDGADAGAGAYTPDAGNGNATWQAFHLRNAVTAGSAEHFLFLTAEDDDIAETSDIVKLDAVTVYWGANGHKEATFGHAATNGGAPDDDQPTPYLVLTTPQGVVLGVSAAPDSGWAASGSSTFTFANVVLASNARYRFYFATQENAQSASVGDVFTGASSARCNTKYHYSSQSPKSSEDVACSGGATYSVNTRVAVSAVGEEDTLVIEPTAEGVSLVSGVRPVVVQGAAGGIVNVAAGAVVPSVTVKTATTFNLAGDLTTPDFQVLAATTFTNATDVTLSARMIGSAALTKTGDGSLVFNRSGLASSLVSFTTGKIVYSGAESKIGSSAYFNMKGTSCSLDIAPGEGNTITLSPDYLVNSTDLNTPNLNFGPGTVVYTRGEDNVNNNGCFARAHLNILEGGKLTLGSRQMLGWSMVQDINVAAGGELVFANMETLTRNLYLNGGTLTLTADDTAKRSLDIFKVANGGTVTATATSEIRSAAGGDATIWLRDGSNNQTFPFTVAAGATLTVDAVFVDGTNTSSMAAKAVSKAGDGTLKLTKANTATGTLSVNAGTLELDGGSWAGTVNVTASGALNVVKSEPVSAGGLLASGTFTLADGASVKQNGAAVDVTVKSDGIYVAVPTVTISVPKVANTTIEVSVGGTPVPPVTEGGLTNTYAVANGATVTVAYTSDDYEVSGGTFEFAASEGYAVDASGVTTAQYVASIAVGETTTKYTSLQAAFNATAQTYSKVVLLANEAVGATIPAVDGKMFYFYAGAFTHGEIANAEGNFITTATEEEIEIGSVTVTATKYRVQAAVALVVPANEQSGTYYGDYMAAYNAFLAGPVGTTMQVFGVNPFSAELPCTTYDSATQTYTRLAAVASITAGQVTSNYPSLADAFEAAEDGQTIKVIADNALTNTIEITANNLALDLNGFTVTGAEGDHFMFELKAAINFTIADTSEGGAGKAYSAASKVVLANGQDCNFTLTSGTLESGSSVPVYIFGDGTKHTYSVAISGGTLKSSSPGGELEGRDYCIYATSGTITFTGGTIDSTVGAFEAKTVNVSGGSVTVGSGSTVCYGSSFADYTYNFTGGTFNKDVGTYCATGYAATETSPGSGWWTVASIYQARVGETKYASLQEAVDGATALGQTVVLLKDVALDAPVTNSAGQAFTLDLDGHTLTGPAGGYVLENAGAVAITGGGVVTGAGGLATNTVGGASLAVSNGTYTVTGELFGNVEGATIAVSGGTYSAPVDPAYCAEGYEARANADGTYGVRENRGWIYSAADAWDYTGTWSGDVALGAEKAAVGGIATYTADRPSAEQLVTLVLTLGFDDACNDDEAIDGAKAAVRLGQDGESPDAFVFQLYTTNELGFAAWVDVAAEGVAATTNVDYAFTFVLDMTNRTYTAMVSNVTTGAAAALAQAGLETFGFAAANAGDTVQSVEFAGSGTVTSIRGDYEPGPFVPDPALFYEDDEVTLKDDTATLTAGQAAWLNAIGDKTTVVGRLGLMTLKQFGDAYLLNLDITKGASRDYSFGVESFYFATEGGKDYVVVEASLARHFALDTDINGTVVLLGTDALGNDFEVLDEATCTEDKEPIQEITMGGGIDDIIFGTLFTLKFEKDDTTLFYKVEIR